MIAAKVDGELAGMLVDYALAEPNSTADIEAAEPVIGSMLRLENLVTGSWYVNMLAVFRQFRGQGIGRLLLEESERRATAAGRSEHSVIVEDDNPARRLYEAFGFEAVGAAPYVPFDGSLKRGGEFVVMRRAVKG
jgi:ribosomal protein S18 acetylase RimI-like enzyme